VYYMPENTWELTQHRIKTFAYQSFHNFNKSYKSRLIKYRERNDLRDYLKVWALAFSTVFFFLFFLYYINLASTRGYFLRVADYEQKNAKEKSDIVKLDVIRKKKANRDKVQIPKNVNLEKSLVIIDIPNENEKVSL
jgi:hypothetical protein